VSRIFTHTADLGDIIAALPTIRTLGGGRLIIGEKKGRDGGRESLRGARFEALKPLLQRQPYLDSVEWADELPESRWDFSTFRHDHRKGESLAQWQARHLGVSISETPWLLATPSPKTRGRVVFARSLRYHSPAFPWDKALLRFKDPLFIGLPEEYMAFQTKWGKPLENHTCSNLLELAELIAGCELFVGNQSCPFWIAVSMGVPLIQETWAHDPNSIIERPNARYALNGALPL
jgi:hypothetical protein